MAATIYGVASGIAHPIAGPFPVDLDGLLAGDLDRGIEGRPVDVAIESPIESARGTVDPTEGVEHLHGRAGGWHTWTVEEVRQFEAKFPIGTKARLAPPPNVDCRQFRLVQLVCDGGYRDTKISNLGQCWSCLPLVRQTVLASDP